MRRLTFQMDEINRVIEVACVSVLFGWGGKKNVDSTSHCARDLSVSVKRKAILLTVATFSLRCPCCCCKLRKKNQCVIGCYVIVNVIVSFFCCCCCPFQNLEELTTGRRRCLVLLTSYKIVKSGEWREREERWTEQKTESS